MIKLFGCLHFFGDWSMKSGDIIFDLVMNKFKAKVQWASTIWFHLGLRRCWWSVGANTSGKKLFS